MKKLFICLSLFTIHSSLFTLCQAQTADEIINKYIDAMGGMAKLSSIKTVYMEDSINACSMKIPLKIWIENNKAMRAEFTVSGMTGYQIMRTDSGWGFNPMAGQKQAEPVTKDEVKKGIPDLDINHTLVNYKAKGYKAAYEGKDNAEGTDAYKIKITISDSASETYFIDPDTYYIIQIKEKKTENGKVMEETATLNDYKKTPDGYIFPMETTSANMGDMKTYTIKVNTTFDDKLFRPSTPASTGK
jgi:hypothetical protein